VKVPGHLASLSRDLGFTLIYISTGKTFRPFFIFYLPQPICAGFLFSDYVFDGTSPPYEPTSQTNPLQLYGKTKRDGELAVSSITGAEITILRVPVLSVPIHHWLVMK